MDGLMCIHCEKMAKRAHEAKERVADLIGVVNEKDAIIAELETEFRLMEERYRLEFKVNRNLAEKMAEQERAEKVGIKANDNIL